MTQRDNEQKRWRYNNELTDSECKRHKDGKPESDYAIKKYENYTAYKPLPPSPVSTLKCDDKENVCTLRGKSWSDRMDDQEIKESKGPLSSDGSNRSQNIKHPNSNKENKPVKKFVVKPLETDDRKLQVRQRQLDIGKGTDGYKKYIHEVRRKERTPHHPRTPNKYTVCSTRSWQGTVRIWRRKLHYWDSPTAAKSQQLKFVNILTSPYMFDEEGSNDEEEVAKIRRINNSIDTEDCVSGSSQNSSEGTESNVELDEPLSESMQFWSGI